MAHAGQTRIGNGHAPGLTLVLGGARSGKSRYAESVVEEFPPPWIYVATAEAHDEEMRQRIVQHKKNRDERWTTLEAPLDLVTVLTQADGPLLVDCLTLWLSNLMMNDRDPAEGIARLDQALGRVRYPLVLVSSEVGLGIVPDNAMARSFRDRAGLLHQRLAARADRVVMMVAGLPLVVK